VGGVIRRRPERWTWRVDTCISTEPCGRTPVFSGLRANLKGEAQRGNRRSHNLPNRGIRTRMYGGVGGGGRKADPYPDSLDEKSRGSADIVHDV
jgi:hypothetical protein